jgi:uncharacterized protein YijF (DUF1287 family)
MMVMTATGSAMPTLLLLLLLSTQPPANGAPLAEAARQQIGVTILYDPSYQRLKYPGGDVPLDRGVCTDVIIRAYRKQGIDLQVLVHQDLLQAPEAYQRGVLACGIGSVIRLFVVRLHKEQHQHIPFHGGDGAGGAGYPQA